jgi:hypothetical protein
MQLGPVKHRMSLTVILVFQRDAPTADIPEPCGHDDRMFDAFRPHSSSVCAICVGDRMADPNFWQV